MARVASVEAVIVLDDFKDGGGLVCCLYSGSRHPYHYCSRLQFCYATQSNECLGYYARVFSRPIKYSVLRSIP